MEPWTELPLWMPPGQDGDARLGRRHRPHRRRPACGTGRCARRSPTPGPGWSRCCAAGERHRRADRATSAANGIDPAKEAAHPRRLARPLTPRCADVPARPDKSGAGPVRGASVMDQARTCTPTTSAARSTTGWPSRSARSSTCAPSRCSPSTCRPRRPSSPTSAVAPAGTRSSWPTRGTPSCTATSCRCTSSSSAHRHPPGGRIDSAVGDARALDLADGSVDAVLLLGPLYHLEDRGDRRAGARRGRRVGRPAPSSSRPRSPGTRRACTGS